MRLPVIHGAGGGPRRQLLTASRLKAFRRCPRYHHYRYVLGYRAASESEALRFGTLVHRALQRWWEAHLQDAQRTAVLEAFRASLEASGRAPTEDEERLVAALDVGAALEAALASLEGEADAFDRTRATILIEAYHHRWSTEALVPIAVEIEFQTPLINPDTGLPSRTFLLAGKIDVIAVERRTGRIVVIEHKTSSESFDECSMYRARLTLNNQISVYFRGAEALGYPPAACLYDVVGKPPLRPLRATPPAQRKYTKEKRDKDGVLVEPARLYRQQREVDETPGEYAERLRDHVAERPDAYLARFEIVRLESELAEHAKDLWHSARAIRDTELDGYAPKNDEGCFAFGRPCEFLPVCTGEASLDEGERFVCSDDVHPELTEGRARQ